MRNLNHIGPNNRNINRNINRYPNERTNQYREHNSMAMSRIDSMSYEELLELENKMGSVSKGLKQSQIDQLLSEVFTESKNESDQSCIICQNDFQKGNIIRRLACNHIFHKDCIDSWLLNNKTCPIDFIEVKFEDESFI